MKVVIIGATGLIGGAVARLVEGDHQVVRVGHSSGEYKVDLGSRESIEQLFEKIGEFDALICAAGNARFKPLMQLGDEDFAFSLANKLMGQVNLVRIGERYIADGGSFTLTSGVLANRPMPGSAAVSIVNAGVEAFVRSAALELDRGVRANVVSPPWIRETLEAMGRDGSHAMAVADVARAYTASLFGEQSGMVIDAQDFA